MIRLPPVRVFPILNVKSQYFKPSFSTANEQVVREGSAGRGPGGQWKGEGLPGSWLISANNFQRSDENSVKHTLFHMKETPAFHQLSTLFRRALIPGFVKVKPWHQLPGSDVEVEDAL